MFSTKRRMFSTSSTTATAAQRNGGGGGGGNIEQKDEDGVTAVDDADEGLSHVIAHVSKAIVQIRLLVVRSVEGCPTGSALATGFIVDKALGLVLTNRHVVTTAPAICEIVFKNDEEVEAHQLYIDPVHDFGFLKFDPSKVKFMEIDELRLNPHGARKDVEVRVVGSDAGEKFMVLRGTISRVDRNAPECEFASCDTSGGSSGSPVINMDSEVIALNCGGATTAASSFFLPLDRILRALNIIRSQLSSLSQNDTPDFPPTAISRGSLHCVFRSVSLAECARLGVTVQEESSLRESLPHVTELLVVSNVTPKSAAYNAGLKDGDVLLKVNDHYLNHFYDLEALLDESVGNEVRMMLKRGPKTTVSCAIQVMDAHTNMPNQFIEFSAGIISPISLARAKYLRLALNAGVYVDWHGYSLGNADILIGSVITKVEETEIHGLADFERALIKYAPGRYISMSYFHINSRHRVRQALVLMDCTWYPLRRATRNPTRFGQWMYAPILIGGAIVPEKPLPLTTRSVSFRHLPSVIPEASDPRYQHAVRAVCHVYFQTPIYVDGVALSKSNGAGFIVDRALGLVVASRATVVSMLGDIFVSVASFKRPAKVLCLHPLHNICILQFDPTGFDELGQLEQGSRSPVRLGETLTLLGLTRQSRVLFQRKLLTVIGKEHVSIPTPFTPRFTAKNFEFLSFQRYISDRCIGGALLDDETGETRAFVLQTFLQSAVRSDDAGDGNEGDTGGGTNEGEVVSLFSFPSCYVFDCVDKVRKALMGLTAPLQTLYSLGCEVRTCSFSEAQEGFNLPITWCGKIAEARERLCGEEESHRRREVYQVATVVAGYPPSESLRSGDILLEVEGEPIVAFTDQVEQRADMLGREKKLLNLTMLRDGEIHHVHVQPASLSVTGTTRLITFAGIQVQETHDAARFHGYVPPAIGIAKKTGVYVSSIRSGSPAEKSRVNPVHWITMINDIEVGDLDDVKRIVTRLKHREIMRLRTVNWQGMDGIHTVQLNMDHWPTSELTYDLAARAWDLQLL